jgi:hypothetical protein
MTGRAAVRAFARGSRDKSGIAQECGTNRRRT